MSSFPDTSENRDTASAGPLNTAMAPPPRRGRNTSPAGDPGAQGWSDEAGPETGERVGVSASQGITLGGWLVLAVALPLATWVLFTAWQLVRVDFGTLQARQMAAQCASVGKGWTDAEWQRAEADLLWGVSLASHNPVLQDSLALLYACEGTLAWSDEAARRQPFVVARGHYEASLDLRPGHGPTLAGLATSILGSGGALADFHAAWHEALRYGPHEAAVQVPLFELALRTWDQATPDMKRWVLAQYAAATPENQKRLAALADKLGHADVLR